MTLFFFHVPVTTETHRHAGHADIVRETIDGEAGLRDGNDNLPDVDAGWWRQHRECVELAALSAADGGHEYRSE